MRGVTVGLAVADRHLGGRLEQRAGDEPQPRGRGQWLPGDVGSDPEADGVLGRARLKSGRQARQHRGLAEQLAFAQQVQHMPVVHDLDRATAHDAKVRDRLGSLGKDRRAGRMGLDLRGGGHPLDSVDRQRVERRMLAQEARDLRRRSCRVAHGRPRVHPRRRSLAVAGAAPAPLKRPLAARSVPHRPAHPP